MTLSSSEITHSAPAPTSPTTATPELGPTLEYGNDPADTLRIRARRAYTVTQEELFAAWTRRDALDVWLRLRSRSRVMLAPQRGGAFRLELAEGPTIHLITGSVLDVRSPEYLSLSWVHHEKSDQPCLVEISFRERLHRGEISLLHRHIENRREAAWLMQLWSSALRRLGAHLGADSPLARSA